MSDDQRIKKTKQRLFSAYLRLLTRKTPAEITILELTKEADINRVTFYKHYKNTTAFHNTFVQHYLDELYQFMKPLNYKDYAKGFEYEALLQLLSYIKENEAVYRVLLTSPYMREFNQQFLAFLKHKLMTHTAELARLEFPGTNVNPMIVSWYGVSAICGTITMWAEADFNFSPEQLAKSIIQLTPH